jgi:hypothetical protein
VRQLYKEDTHNIIELTKPGLCYRARLVKWDCITPDEPPACLQCGSADDMVHNVFIVEHLSISITRYFNWYQCMECGGQLCLTCDKDDGKLT